jgi:orotidine-5'-phosphate decarboxylase
VNRLIISLDVPSATEARRAARALSSTGVGVRLGPRLLHRVGPSVIAAIRPDAAVFADARISGSDGEMLAAARSLAAVGARWISVEGQMGPDAVRGAVEGVASYGASIVTVTVAPEAIDPPGGRGRSVSAASRTLADSGVVGFLGVVADIGVVAQTTPSIPVMVFDVDTPEAVGDALSRGAGAAIVDAGVGRASDPARAVTEFVEAARTD